VPSVNFNYSFQSRSPLINGFVDQLLVGPSRYALCLWDSPNHDRNSVKHLAAEHLLQHNRRDLCPDCSAARQKARWSRLRSAAEARPLTSQWRYTVFAIVFPVELGCFYLFYPITKLVKIFARNLHMLLKIDYISTCIIHFKCTLFLEDIISRHLGGRFFMAHSV